MLITINVDNVGTISNLYWSVMFSYFLWNPIPPHGRESGFLNPGNFAFGIGNLGYFACGI